MPANQRAPGGQIAEAGMPASGMCSLAEAVNGFYKTELIRRRGPWRTVEQLDARIRMGVERPAPPRRAREAHPNGSRGAYYADLESARPPLVSQGNR